MRGSPSPPSPGTATGGLSSLAPTPLCAGQAWRAPPLKLKVPGVLSPPPPPAATRRAARRECRRG